MHTPLELGVRRIYRYGNKAVVLVECRLGEECYHLRGTDQVENDMDLIALNNDFQLFRRTRKEELECFPGLSLARRHHHTVRKNVPNADRGPLRKRMITADYDGKLIVEKYVRLYFIVSNVWLETEYKVNFALLKQFQQFLHCAMILSRTPGYCAVNSFTASIKTGAKV